MSYEIDLLGRQLTGREFEDEVFQLTADDLADPFAADLFAAITAARNAGRSSLDVFAAREWLDTNRPIENESDRIIRNSNVIDAARNLNHGLAKTEKLVAQIKDAAGRRKLRGALIEAAMRVSDTVALPTLEDALASVSHSIESAVEVEQESGVITGKDLADIGLQFISDRYDGKAWGVPTGFRDLDDVTFGLKPGELWVIAGRPGMGKTTMATNIADNIASEGKRVLLVSREMGKVQTAVRTYAAHSGISMTEIQNGHLDDSAWAKLTVAVNKIAELGTVFDFSSRTLAQVRSRARRMQRRGGIDLVVIDHVGLMHSERRSERRDLEIAELSRDAKEMALSMGIPVVLLSQLNRGVESRPNKRPGMADLRESGALEQDADIIIGMYRDEYYNSDSPYRGITEAIVLKQRMGECKTVPLIFDGAHNRFRDGDLGSFADAKSADEGGNSLPAFRAKDTGL